MAYRLPPSSTMATSATASSSSSAKEQKFLDNNDFFHDLSGGLAYSARRMYLRGDSDNPLQPPSDFMTRKQMRNSLKVNRGSGLEGLRTLDFIRDGEAAEAKKEKNRKQQQEGRLKRKETVHEIQLFSSIKREDWQEQLQAGCRMWVNHDTGEVSSRCPFIDDGGAPGAGTRPSSGADDTLATGAAVYDSSELEALFAALDSAGAKKTS